MNTTNRGPGRPPADPSGAQQVCKVRLTPAEIAFLRSKYGTVNAGLRHIVMAAMLNLPGKPADPK